ncbi:HD-GYP domain-containing protein [Accumulibacter sp.]|uniref:HD-GYP domain-containing protein n=1 Tax=Accumulibacter sp. TaxID=2053492 RepID=UPI002BF76711|nr:HD-GYP domain-containing protein [Accumulibacter sp.]HNB67751.1 HD-GYP domain-containing protein [Accumulibacter sp.]HNC26564.1 HD-GYP domain-containing protein [Accumulibacter sp.]HND39320.1 HD-GYP domain-containing protein [Accumulibacter sp.]HNG86683.1 HD-GYP domain-containing protein [Accumulibacter sp.]HNL96764.1 HD-GYP domain-containing protein [Accumulibacter sp.]
MLKRISVDQLALGMHIKEFCGSWMEHPFWRSAFVLNDPADLQAIRTSSIKEVWIDCSKGIDVAPEEKVVSLAESEAQVDAELAALARTTRDLRRVPAAAEFNRAARIVARSRQAVTSMFEEARLGRAVDTGGAQRLVEEISDSVTRNPGALISLARLKTADDYTYMHSVAVCALMVALARQLGIAPEETRSIGIAGLLHDLGKAQMPSEVLNKPGKLTDAEFAIIKSHPEAGYRMLCEGAAVDSIALDVVLHHHEKVDGSGYPERLQGDAISLYAKMGAVCDVYDAITSNRPYKAGWDPAESLRKMAEWSKGHFDPTVFQAFVKAIGIYPIGSLVRLSCGRLAVVVEQGEQSLLSPRVKVFFSTRANARIAPEVIDLARPGLASKIVNREDPAKWNFPDLQEIWSANT